MSSVDINALKKKVKLFSSTLNKPIQKSIRVGFQAMIRDAKAGLKASGIQMKNTNLTKSLGIKPFKFGTGAYVGIVNRGGSKTNRLWITYFFEKGTVQRKTKAGKNRGQVKGYYFWKNALMRHLAEAEKCVQMGVDTGVQMLNRM